MTVDRLPGYRTYLIMCMLKMDTLHTVLEYTCIYLALTLRTINKLRLIVYLNEPRRGCKTIVKRLSCVSVCLCPFLDNISVA